MGNQSIALPRNQSAILARIFTPKIRMLARYVG